MKSAFKLKNKKDFDFGKTNDYTKSTSAKNYSEEDAYEAAKNDYNTDNPTKEQLKASRIKIRKGKPYNFNSK
tara:strand:+ start:651 stop:866 length:216 start_codon:yes stop_codon:yes gene_type:complete